MGLHSLLWWIHTTNIQKQETGGYCLSWSSESYKTVEDLFWSTPARVNRKMHFGVESNSPQQVKNKIILLTHFDRYTNTHGNDPKGESLLDCIYMYSSQSKVFVSKEHCHLTTEGVLYPTWTWHVKILDPFVLRNITKIQDIIIGRHFGHEIF